MPRRWAPTASRSSSRTPRGGRSRRREPTPRSFAAPSLPLYVHAPYLINVCSPEEQRPLRLAEDPPADLRGGRRGRGHRGDRPPGPRRGRDRGRDRPLGADAGAAREPGSALHREHRRWRQRGGAPVRRPGAAVGAWSRARRPTSRGASASTPATLTPPARSCPTRSSGCWRSWAGSTSCTPTTRATRPAPAPTATRTSARARSDADALREMIRAAKAPVVCETPGDRRRHARGPGVRARGARRLSGRSVDERHRPGSSPRRS